MGVVRTSTLLVLADANQSIGIGHVMRMVALGQAWAESGGRVVCLTDSPPPVVERLKSEGFAVVGEPAAERSAESVAELARQHAASWVALDGYGFTAEFTRRLRATGLCVLQMDDVAHQAEYDVDILVNQNPGAEALPYVVNAGARCLLGPRYALLRKEFRRHPRRERARIGSPLRVLVTMGGADPRNVTLRVLKALAASGLAAVEISALLGPANPHRPEIAEFLAATPQRVTLLEHIPDMAEFLFNDVDFVISAASSTCFEVAYAGLPFVAVQTADNQRLIASGLDRLDAALVLPSGEESAWPARLRGLLCDRDALRQLAAKTALVDGWGGLRVADELKASRVALRRAGQADGDDLFRWRNHPSVRQHSRSKEELGYAGHCAWLTRVLNDPDRCLLIAYVDGCALGVLRFDRSALASQSEVSIYLVPEMQGKGWGTALLLAGINWYRANSEVQLLVATVLPENIQSMKVFSRAGFMPDSHGFSFRMRS